MFPRHSVPEPYRIVRIPSGQRGPIRAKRYAFDPTRMLNERPFMFPRYGIPQLYCPVHSPIGKCRYHPG